MTNTASKNPLHHFARFEDREHLPVAFLMPPPGHRQPAPQDSFPIEEYKHALHRLRSDGQPEDYKSPRFVDNIAFACLASTFNGKRICLPVEIESEITAFDLQNTRTGGALPSLTIEFVRARLGDEVILLSAFDAPDGLTEDDEPALTIGPRLESAA